MLRPSWTSTTSVVPPGKPNGCGRRHRAGCFSRLSPHSRRAKVESLADLLRAFNYQNGVHVEYKVFYHCCARLGFAAIMRGRCVRPVEQLRVQTLASDGQPAVALF